jgi:hypothetical protein
MSNITRIRLRRDTAANWTAANPILGDGEVGLETDTQKFKAGDGVLAWSALSYYPASTTAMVRGQASKMDSGTIEITTQGVYITTGLTATLDASTANGMELGTTHAFALKNTSGGTKLLRFFGSIDARTVTGNNQTLGVKLAYNGVAIDATECRAFTGTGTEEAKLVTSWMISVASNDEVSLFIANHSGSGDISFRRGRLVASEVFA